MSKIVVFLALVLAAEFTDGIWRGRLCGDDLWDLAEEVCHKLMRWPFPCFRESPYLNLNKNLKEDLAAVCCTSRHSLCSRQRIAQIACCNNNKCSQSCFGRPFGRHE